VYDALMRDVVAAHCTSPEPGAVFVLTRYGRPSVQRAAITLDVLGATPAEALGRRW
jgi:hypothetical protein